MRDDLAHPQMSLLAAIAPVDHRVTLARRLEPPAGVEQPAA